MKNITQLPIEEVKPGQKLGHNVQDAKGNRLLASGVILTDNMLSMLKRRNIRNVSVKEENSLSDDELFKMKQEIEANVGLIFRKVKDVPTMQKLKSLILEYRYGEVD